MSRKKSYCSYINDEEDDLNDGLLNQFVLPPEIEEKRMTLQILDSSGNIEDILIDIEEIYRYVRNVYKKCPKRD